MKLSNIFFLQCNSLNQKLESAKEGIWRRTTIYRAIASYLKFLQLAKSYRCICSNSNLFIICIVVAKNVSPKERDEVIPKELRR